MCVCACVCVCALVVVGLVRGRCGQEAKVAGFVCVCVYTHACHAYICSHTHVILDYIYIYICDTLYLHFCNVMQCKYVVMIGISCI